jgi:hypothetical protein
MRSAAYRSTRAAEHVSEAPLTIVPTGAAVAANARTATDPNGAVTLSATYCRAGLSTYQAKLLKSLVGAQGLEPWTR